MEFLKLIMDLFDSTTLLILNDFIINVILSLVLVKFNPIYHQLNSLTFNTVFK